MFDSGHQNLTGGWFSPSNAIKPVAPDGFGFARALDYPVGVNLQIKPKIADTFSDYNYSTLRQLANSCDYIKIAVQTVIDRMSRMTGHVVDDTNDDKDKTATTSAKANKINDWFKHPDGITSRTTWTGKALRDLLEIDAPAAFTDPQEKKARILDGATIAARISEDGDVAYYQQIIKGMPAHDYTREEIVWKPRNQASYKLYGMSPVETIAFTVEIALRRHAMQLGFFTDGNIPAALIEAPAHWNSVQIAKANRAWSLMRKGASARNQATFIPNGAKPYPLDRDPSKTEFDEWLMTIIAFAFSFAKTPFVKETNRATAETLQDSAEREGHEAMCVWLKDFYDDVIFGVWGPGYHWEWLLDEKPDAALISSLVIAGALKTKALLRLGFTEDEIPDSLPGANATEPEGSTIGKKVVSSDVDGNLSPKDPKVKAPKSPPKTIVSAPPGSKKTTVKNADVRINNADVESDLEIVLQDYLDILQKEAVKKGLDAFSALSVDIDLDDDPSFALRIAPHIKQATINGVSAGKEEVPSRVTSDELENAAEEYARNRGAEMVGRIWKDGKLVENPNSEWSIAQTTRDNLRSVLSNGIASGMTPEQIAQAISENDPSFGPARSRMIARTETAAAQEEGRTAYFKAAGIKQKQWSDQDGCEVCQANAAQGPIGINEDFQSGDAHAPAHPHCRCTVIPVGEASEIDDAEGGSDED